MQEEELQLQMVMQLQLEPLVQEPAQELAQVQELDWVWPVIWALVLPEWQQPVRLLVVENTAGLTEELKMTEYVWCASSSLCLSIMREHVVSQAFILQAANKLVPGPPVPALIHLASHSSFERWLLPLPLHPAYAKALHVLSEMSYHQRV